MQSRPDLGHMGDTPTAIRTSECATIYRWGLEVCLELPSLTQYEDDFLLGS